MRDLPCCGAGRSPGRLEMHSGQGRGFPVIYVVIKDEIVTVLFQPDRLV